MTEPLAVEVSNLATSQIAAADEWWCVNRPKAPRAIAEELERAVQLISAQPHLGARARNASLEGVRRLHLARIRYHLYYRVVEVPRRVEVLAFWHVRRGSGPPI